MGKNMKLFQIVFRIIGIPLLITLYLLVGIPLMFRQFFHLCCIFFDYLFDLTAQMCGWDTTFWPLPKAQDNPLPYKDIELDS